LLNDKEVSAIAAEVARQIMTAKMSGMVGKQTSMAQAQVSTTMLQFIAQEAARLMAAAKIDEKINDDGLDKMLDIKTSWDRKIYGKRWNPLK
jgi:D-hexose-6-phosphate mutarotase